LNRYPACFQKNKYNGTLKIPADTILIKKIENTKFSLQIYANYYQQNYCSNKTLKK